MRALSGVRITALLAAGLLIVGCRGSGGDTTETGTDKPPGDSPAPKNNPPTISGTPAVEITAGSDYVFEPRATDADGDPLQYEISSRPAWAQFDATTGRLTGRPTDADEGMHPDITISVSDAKSSASLLPFGIMVKRAAASVPPIDKDADFASRVAVSKAWYANNFSKYSSLDDALREHGLPTTGDTTEGNSRDLNTDPRFSLSGGKSLRNTMMPTARQGGKFRVEFNKWAPAGPQKDGNSVREFYLQYAVYWTHEALTWTHRDAQKGEAYKTLLLEGYGNGQIQPGMQRRMGVVAAAVNGANGCERKVTTPSRATYYFVQNALDDPAVTVPSTGKLEDYIAKYGLATAIRNNSAWGYVQSQADWSYKGRWETGGDWSRNLIDHPDRGHPYGGWGWPELTKPAGQTAWVKDGWTVVEIYVKQDPTVIGFSSDGKPQYNPQTFRIWAAPYGEAPRLVLDSRWANCALAYNSDYYQWFNLLYYDTNVVESGGFGAKVDARTFQPTATQFELIYEPEADDRPKGHPYYSVANPADKTVGVEHEFVGNRIGWNTGTLKGQLYTIVDSQFVGMVQDGVDSDGQPLMKHKTRLTVQPMPEPPVGGTGSATSLDTPGDYLQVQTFAEEGYRPPLSIYYDELLVSYEPIPFAGHLDTPLPQP